MSDPTNDAGSPNGWVKLYAPSGVLVTLPVPVDAGVEPDYAHALRAVAAALEVGWLATAPGLEAGEQKFTCVAAVRREIEDKESREVTSVMDLYEGDFEYRSLAVYLNRPEDVEAFEKASGLNVGRMDVFPGKAPIQRGQSRRDDEKYVRATRPFGVVCKPNPKHDPAETDVKKKKPRRLFVRWEGAAATPPAGTATSAPAKPAGRDAAWFRLELEKGPDLKRFNDLMAFFPPKGDPDNAVVAALYTDHAELCGWEFDRTDRQWVMKSTAGAYSSPDDGTIPF